MAPTAVQKVASRAQDLLGEVGSRLIPGRADKAERQRHRWLAVTLEGDAAEIAGRGELPAPLAELGDSVEVEIRPGPGRWGTEIAARPVSTGVSVVADRQARGELRAALRKSKQLLEVGEVLVAEPRPEGHRPATVAGKLVDRAELSADEGGLL
jgi:hypothetical protein